MYIVNDKFISKLNKSVIIENEKKERHKWMWVVLIGCVLFQVFPFTIIFNLNSVLADQHWSKWLNGNITYIGISYTLSSLTTAIISPFIAKIFKKEISDKLIYSIGVVISMFGFIIPAFIPLLFSSSGYINHEPSVIAILYISRIIAAVGGFVFSGLGMNNLISKWWPAERRGFALGLASAGGSLGNIIFQQSIKPMFVAFHGESSYIIYIILGFIGLIFGILICIFMLKKPLPPINIFNDKTSKIKIKKSKTTPSKNTIGENVPIIVATKMPMFWILCTGFFIMQLGSTHNSISSIFISNATYFGMEDKSNISSLIANGFTVFGVSCLIGNTLGGIMSDKIGPTKSMFLATLMQVLSIFCLLYSVKDYNLVYLYFILSGLSIYVYRIMPAFMSGRLFGTKYSNEYVVIIGFFLSFGFSLTNSISGLLTGNVKEGVITSELFGIGVGGSFLNWGLYSIFTCLIGGLLCTISSFFISRKTIKRILEQNHSIFSFYYSLKYLIYIDLLCFKIIAFKKDFRKNDKWIRKIEERNKNDKYFECKKTIINNFIRKYKVIKLTNEEVNALKEIFYYQIIEQKLANILKISPKILKLLERKNLISIYDAHDNYTFICIKEQIIHDVYGTNSQLYSRYKKVFNSIKRFKKRIYKLNNSYEIKKEKILKKIELVTNSKNSKIKNDKLIQKSVKKLFWSIEDKEEWLASDISRLNDWEKYKNYYELSKRQEESFQLRNQFEIRKNQKIEKLKKQIIEIRKNKLFHINENIRGNFNMLNLLNNKQDFHDKAINNILESYYNREIDKSIHRRKKWSTRAKEFQSLKEKFIN